MNLINSFDLVDEVTSLTTSNMEVLNGGIYLSNINLDGYIDTGLKSYVNSLESIRVNADSVAVYIGNVLYYFDISDDTWKLSDGSINESTKKEDLDFKHLPLTGDVVNFRLHIEAENLQEIEPLRYLEINHSLNESFETAPAQKCVISGQITDVSGMPVVGAELTFSPVKKDPKMVLASDNVVIIGDSKCVTNEFGSFEISLIPSTRFKGLTEVEYSVKFKIEGAEYSKDLSRKALKIIVPDTQSAFFEDLILI